MTVCKSSELLSRLEHALTEPEGDSNPFVREGDATFMRYDEIRIRQIGGALAVEYWWQGKAIYTETAGCDLSAGGSLAFAASGRIRVRVM